VRQAARRRPRRIKARNDVARRRATLGIASLDSHRGEIPYHFGPLKHGFPQGFAFLQG
jgi:hypothetical protein